MEADTYRQRSLREAAVKVGIGDISVQNHSRETPLPVDKVRKEDGISPLLDM